MDLTGLGPIAQLAQDALDKIFPDKEAQAKQREDYMLKAQELDNQLAQGQLAINTAEASSNSIFIAGARPFFLWVCGVAFAYKYVIEPFLIFALISTGSDFDYHKLPVLEWADMLAIAAPLLGVSGMRSYEKVKGAS